VTSATARREAPVLVEVGVVLDAPFEVARDRLALWTPRILAAVFAGEPGGRGGELLGRVGPFGPRGPGAQPVVVQYQGPRCLRGRLVLGLRWVPARARVVLPSLDGEVLLEPLGPASCELSCLGAYRPPGGGLGRSLDRLGLHRVGELTLRAVARSVAEAVVAMDPAPVLDSAAFSSGTLDPGRAGRIGRS